jgi:hypothetical protein
MKGMKSYFIVFGYCFMIPHMLNEYIWINVIYGGSHGVTMSISIRFFFFEHL